MIWILIVTDGRERAEVRYEAVGQDIPATKWDGFYECKSGAGQRVRVNPRWVVFMYPEGAA